MRKVKKLFALTIIMVMMFAMNITAFATSDPEVPTATVTIENLPTTAVISYEKIVGNDAAGGWKILSQQTIFDTFKKNGITDPLEGYAKATEKERVDAFASAAVSDEAEELDPGDNSFEVKEPGLYLIHIEDTNEDYEYKNMVASIGFDYDETTGAATLTNCTFNAKMGNTKVEKTGNNQFVENLEVVEYTVKARIPYIPGGSAPEGNYEYLVAIKDVLTGGEYVTEDDGTLTVDYTIGTESGKLEGIVVDSTDNSVMISLDKFILDNGKVIDTYANQNIVLKYSAKIKEDVLKNEATPIYWGKEKTTVTFKAVAGRLEIKKLAAPEEPASGDLRGSSNPQPLAGAKFVIINDESKYAKLDDTFRLLEWVDTKEEATQITTLSDGIAKAYGFNRKNAYQAVEVAAPTGYSVDDTPVDLVWVSDMYLDDSDPTTIIEEQYAQGSLDDTKLIELPYTGGKGTAAFTGFGVLLMSVAAGLYFANKKNKSVK